MFTLQKIVWRRWVLAPIILIGLSIFLWTMGTMFFPSETPTGVTVLPTVDNEARSGSVKTGETWSGTLTGKFDTHDGNYAPCLGTYGGVFNEEITISFSTESSLSGSLQGSGKWIRGEGTLSAKEAAARQPLELPCVLADSASNKSITIKGSSEISIKPTTENSLWASATSLSGGKFYAPHQTLTLTPTSVTPSLISGNWRSGPFGANGTFVLTRK